MRNIIAVITVALFFLQCEKKGEIDRVEYYCCAETEAFLGDDIIFKSKRIHYEKDLSNHKAIEQLMKDDICKYKMGVLDLNGVKLTSTEYCGYEVFYKE